jgi:hypothetical protein
MFLQTPARNEHVGPSTEIGVLTMNTTKTLMLAAVAALTIGTGAAMAQEGTTDPGVPYWTLARQADALRVAQAREAARVQAGSSDVGAARSRVGHVLPFNGDFGDLANPG